MKAPCFALAALLLPSLAATAPTPPLVTQDADLPVVAVGEHERATMEPRLADLTWLAGMWKGSDGQSDWESCYTSPEGGQVVGASKEMRGGRVVMTDFEHFYEKDGELRMTPFPFGNRSVEFTLTSFDADARKAVFENPEHDFPKSFVYHRTGETTLSIVLEGDMGGQEARFVLEFEKQG